MPSPPPLPTRPPPSEAALRALVNEARQLEVEDILELCYAFHHDKWRLYAYLEALRQKGGLKSQAAACLICFDLGKKGDSRFQDEFITLVPVMRDYCDMPRGTDGRRPIERLIGDDDYLGALFHDLEHRLAALDPRLSEGSFEEPTLEDVAPAELDLFDDEDQWDSELYELLEQTDERLESEWSRALDRFLGVGMADVNDNDFGFLAHSRAGLGRVERLRDDATSLRTSVRGAEAMLPLTELFLATNLRATNLFGRRNRARDRILKDGLEHFSALTLPPADMVSWLTAPTASEHAWEKVAELMLDYVSFLFTVSKKQLKGTDATALADAYVRAPRPQPPEARLKKKVEGRRRRA